MQVFKAALRIFFRHPGYLLIYVLCLTCLGLFIGMSVYDVSGSEYLEGPSVAIINRDGGEISEGLSSFISERSEVVEIEDSERAMQDAVMQGTVNCIIVIPESFSADFDEYVTNVEEAPEVQTIMCTNSTSSLMISEQIDEYLNVARSYTLALPEADQKTIVERTASACANSAEVDVAQTDNPTDRVIGFGTYLQFESYTILLSIAICSAIALSRFRSKEIQRRITSSAVSATSVNFQLAAACFVVTLIIWAVVSILGVLVFGAKLADVDTSAIAASLFALLCYSIFGLAFGFLMGQITESELVMNALTNITGLVISFLGGAWISLDLVGEPVATIARFTPVYYYSEAVHAALEATDVGFSSALLANCAVVCLFAVAIFSIGLAVSKLNVDRMSSWKDLSTKASSQSAA